MIEEISDFLTQLQPTISQTDSPEAKLTKPRGSRVGLQKNGDRLIVYIPPTLYSVYLLLAAFPVSGLLTMSVLTIPEMVNIISPILKDISDFVGIITWTFLLGFVLIFFWLLTWLTIVKGIEFAIDKIFALSMHLEIDRQTFKIEWRNCFGSRHKIRGQVADLQDVFVADGNTNIANQNENNIRGCTLVEGIRKHSFGSQLNIKEQRWLVAELAEFLGFDKPMN